MRSILALSVALLPSLIIATSPASCPETSNGYQEEKLFFVYRTFCNKLSTTSFATRESFTGSATDPWVSFGFENINGVCTEEICNQDLSTLTTSCKLSNHTIFGGGTLGTECGNYNFTIYSPSFQPGQEGTPTPATILSANIDAAVQSSIEAILTSSFSLTATKNPAVQTTSSSSSSSDSITTPSPTGAVQLSTGISVGNVTVTTVGPFGNSTGVVASTSTMSQVVWTTGTPGVGGSTVTGPPAVESTSASSGQVLRDGGLWLVAAGFAALFLW